MVETETKVRKLPDFKTDRDATLKLMDWFDVDRVHGANVLVIGAGAIGNEVLKNLALLGIGRILIYDKDTIEMSNLSRSVLYRASDDGKPKASTAARAVCDINPNVRVYSIQGDIRFDLGLGLLRRVDVVIGCLDNREARLHINEVCWKMGKPWIDAGIGQLNGQVSVYKPGLGACYECSFSEKDYRQVVVPCGIIASKLVSERKVPTTPTIASLVAGVQVQEALKLLDPERWEGRTLAGREFIFNGTVGHTTIVDLPERDDCPAHSPIDTGSIVEMSDATSKGTTVTQLLAKAREILGATACIELNFDLAVEMPCPVCKTSKRILKPVRKLFRENLSCDGCGWQPSSGSDLVVTHLLGRKPDNYTEDFLDATLAELGIPPLDILEARGPDGSACYLELSGDSKNIFD